MKSGRLFSLNAWPVLQRELREGARRPALRRLRFWSVVAGTGLLWAAVAGLNKPGSEMGAWLFAILHMLLLVLIIVIVPGLTADCLARERREGTLGLLFLTPLSPGGVVSGKLLAQVLRAFTLWLAVLPLLIIPFLTGGVTLLDVITALSQEFCAVLLCLAAGLLASAFVKERNSAFLLALFIGAVFFFCYCQIFVLAVVMGWKGFGAWKDYSPNPVVESVLIFCGCFDTRGVAGWSGLNIISNRIVKLWTWVGLIGPGVVLLFFWVVARIAAWQINRSWRDKIPSVLRAILLRKYCTRLFPRWFQLRKQRTLDWNPVAWLQQYSWKARLSKWGLCLVFIVLAGVAKPDEDSFVVFMLLLMAALYTFVGVSGFLEEKRNGALELLLVTPLSINKLIFGRVWGLWKLFLPAGIVFSGAWVAWRTSELPNQSFDDLEIECVVACCFFALPVFATYFALRVKNVLLAAVLTWAALAVPALLVDEFYALFAGSDKIASAFVLPVECLSYGAFALLACFLLKHSLSRRIYSF